MFESWFIAAFPHSFEFQFYVNIDHTATRILAHCIFRSDPEPVRKCGDCHSTQHHLRFARFQQQYGRRGDRKTVTRLYFFGIIQDPFVLLLILAYERGMVSLSKQTNKQTNKQLPAGNYSIRYWKSKRRSTCLSRPSNSARDFLLCWLHSRPWAWIESVHLVK